MTKIEKLLEEHKIDKKFSNVATGIITFAAIILLFSMIMMIVNKGTFIFEEQLAEYYQSMFISDDYTTFSNPEILFIIFMLFPIMYIMGIALIVQIIRTIWKRKRKYLYVYTPYYIKNYLIFKKNDLKNEPIEKLRKIMMDQYLDKYEQMNKVYALMNQDFLNKKKEFEDYKKFAEEYDVKI